MALSWASARTRSASRCALASTSAAVSPAVARASLRIASACARASRRISWASSSAARTRCSPARSASAIRSRARSSACARSCSAARSAAAMMPSMRVGVSSCMSLHLYGPRPAGAGGGAVDRWQECGKYVLADSARSVTLAVEMPRQYPPRDVVILVYPEVQSLDVTGPLEVFTGAQQLLQAQALGGGGERSAAGSGSVRAQPFTASSASGATACLSSRPTARRCGHRVA